jgi:hypothetical protein
VLDLEAVGRERLDLPATASTAAPGNASRTQRSRIPPRFTAMLAGCADPTRQGPPAATACVMNPTSARSGLQVTPLIAMSNRFSATAARSSGQRNGTHSIRIPVSSANR